jgi:hypothetical protein
LTGQQPPNLSWRFFVALALYGLSYATGFWLIVSGILDEAQLAPGIGVALIVLGFFSWWEIHNLWRISNPRFMSSHQDI